MPKLTVSAEGGAMRAEGQSRRRLLFGLAAIPALTLPSAVAMATEGDDAEIIRLSEEVIRLAEIADTIGNDRIDPHYDRFELHVKRMYLKSYGLTDAKEQETIDFERETGRDAAIQEQWAVDRQADAALERMMDIPCATPAGRAAKVRALLVHVLRTGWRGPAIDLDYDKKIARRLLGEFAGMPEEELANV